MKNFFAIRFNVNAEGVATSYSVLSYRNYLLDLRNAGFQTHLTGFASQADAEVAANGFVGLNLSDPAVAGRLKKKAVIDAGEQSEEGRADAPDVVIDENESLLAGGPGLIGPPDELLPFGPPPAPEAPDSLSPPALPPLPDLSSPRTT